MATGTLTLQPGINTNLTVGANRSGYSACQLIRWREGLPEKMGGWARLTSELLVGVTRAIHVWADLLGNPYLIASSSQRVTLYDGGVLYDITPLRATVDIAEQFSTTIGSAEVNVLDVAHGAAATDWVYISTQVSVGGIVLYGYYQIEEAVDSDNYTIIAADLATANVVNGGSVARFFTTNTLATVTVLLEDHGLIVGDLHVVEVPVTVGGITIDGTYAVTSITDADNFIITHSVVASSTANAFQNSGSVQILYLLGSGLESNEFQSGYGVGDYGSGDYSGSASSGALNHLRLWYWDQWGEQALGNYSGGPFYVWIPPLGTSPRATLVSGAPTMNTASFVSMPQQIAVALGSEVGGVRDPNLVRWSAVADYTDFVATVINQAGSFRIPSGSRIVGGLQGPAQGLIWTDTDLWSMRYIGPPFVFGFTKIGSGCGLMAGRAMAVVGTDVYWMSTNGFFKLGGGGVEVVNCTVYDIIFGKTAGGGDVMNKMQADKIFTAPHSDIAELSFYFPSTDGDGEPDTFVKMHTKDTNGNGAPLWDYATLNRTAWEDENALGPPIGSETLGLLQQHETGSDADGVAMISWVRTGDLDLRDGEQFIFMDQMEADLKCTAGAVIDLTVYGKKTPRGAVRTFGPYRFDDFSGYIHPRVRSKYIAFEIGSSDLGSWWRVGLSRYRYAPDGKGG